MRAQQIAAIILAALLIAIFTGAVLGRVPWIAFWLTALALLAFIQLQKRVSAN